MSGEVLELPVADEVAVAIPDTRVEIQSRELQSTGSVATFGLKCAWSDEENILACGSKAYRAAMSTRRSLHHEYFENHHTSERFSRNRRE